MSRVLDDRVVLGSDAGRALNRKRWTTRIEFATAIHDYIEVFHNIRRRHSGLEASWVVLRMSSYSVGVSIPMGVGY